MDPCSISTTDRNAASDDTLTIFILNLQSLAKHSNDIFDLKKHNSFRPSQIFTALSIIKTCDKLITQGNIKCLQSKCMQIH